ncbi:MAG TPA: TIGR03560 family F420-dependent LLM class oxidoreductase [Candidatus Binataceae bacterium]|nr:TIGR03560 family F420-dependent LLM class oxidoreductase [Candidatus Binataceae bacterium]
MADHPIRFGVQTAQQNTSWEALRDFWARADDWGYDSLWVFDHFYPIFSPDPAGPCFEGWTLLSALSQNTKRARIGALVNGNTYRNPCLVAKMSATLDHASGGRFNLGIGAGWFELEHRSLGFDFKTVGGRLEGLDESCQIIRSMFTNDKTTLKGKHFNVVDAVCNPKPVQKHLPMMIGGHGEKVLLKLVAKHADMWNMTNADAGEMKRLIGTIERHGDTVGRNTDEIEKTLMLALCYKAPKQREETLTSLIAMMAQTTPEKARDRIIIGSKQECIDKLEGFIKAGVTHFIFMHSPPLSDENDIQAFAEDVAPQFRSR